jgi:DNA-binding PadR family transcriptional regulator
MEDDMHGHGFPEGFGPGFRGRHGFGGFGGHGRAKRGDVTPAVLALLKEQDMHGYQIIQELAERSGGAWTPSPGSIYPALQALEDQGYVTSEQVSGKRIFSLTEEGRAHADAQTETAPWQDFEQSAGPKLKLRESMIGLGGAAMQVMRSGTDEQAEKVAGILDEARKSIYLMLAGE